MRRFWLLSFLLLPQLGRSEEAVSPALQEARVVMREGLERELPAPNLRGPPEWPRPTQGARNEARPDKNEALGERVRNEASLRARASAEERRTVPYNQPGVGQSRTKAAKGLGPPDKQPRPPRP